MQDDTLNYMSYDELLMYSEVPKISLESLFPTAQEIWEVNRLH